MELLWEGFISNLKQFSIKRVGLATMRRIIKLIVYNCGLLVELLD